MRYSEFRSFPVSDAVKITYFQWLASEYTEYFIDKFSQDVLQMRTIDWIQFLMMPLAVIVMPLAVYMERLRAVNCCKRDCALGWTSYHDFKLYWRRIDDFSSKPTRWRD